ncbi:hypothetical protein HPB49_022383 [Dermacentor silvarum]|uniref:Uncharacterized protein n=1 Tax=Dermacentor silvarum TaxID=543639 RepID=A0ACB8E4E5_DERSI|nr:hypothetical protein HPB49_022383 [Dermacentor silvarum]
MCLIMIRSRLSTLAQVMLYKDNQLLLTCASRDSMVLAGKTYIPPAYMAFAPSGTGMGPPVYVNYGRLQDFNYFRDTDLHGKVIVVRSGKITGGEKVRNAERVGAAAVVVFPDASDLAPRGDTQPFPDSIWIGGSAIQRGSAAYMRGDPLTPGYPAVESLYRPMIDDAELARTVAQPISYDDARSILKQVSRQAHRDNYGIQSLEEYYRVAIYVPYLDFLTASLARLFSESTERSFKLLQLHPSKMKHLSLVEFAAFAEELQCFYGIDNFKEEAISWEMDGTACPDNWDPMLGIPCFVNATSALQ